MRSGDKRHEGTRPGKENRRVGDRFEGWYAGLPLAVRVPGDIVCLAVCVYVVAWVVSAIGLFGLSSPHAWALSTWGYILLVAAVLGLGYELIAPKLRKA